MKPTQLYRSAAIVGIVGSVLNVIAEFLPASAAHPLNMLVNLLLPFVLTALYLDREASGRLGFAGYVLNTLGLGLVAAFFFAQAFVLPAFDPALVQQLMAGTFGIVVLSSLVLLAVGVILFGIATFRACFPSGL